MLSVSTVVAVHSVKKRHKTSQNHMKSTVKLEESRLTLSDAFPKEKAALKWNPTRLPIGTFDRTSNGPF
jgi:hypothetical protein